MRKKTATELPAYLLKGRIEVDRTLERFLSCGKKSPLRDAMRYSLMAGGKRLRPILAIAAAESVGGNRKAVLPFASAIELIHTYSLVHDDLPAMDNDNLRRGKPTSHIVYGEGTAILVGDALLTEAFTQIAKQKSTIPPEQILRVVFELAASAGMEGMVLGQWLDLQSEGKGTMTLDRLREIHKNKTGALLAASVRIGAIVGQANAVQFKRLTLYGQKVGLAFQIMDDLLDVLGEEATLGKSVGQDQVQEKWTYPRLMGVEKAKQEANRLTRAALRALDLFGKEADPLRWIADYCVNRKS